MSFLYAAAKDVQSQKPPRQAALVTPICRLRLTCPLRLYQHELDQTAAMRQPSNITIGKDRSARVPLPYPRGLLVQFQCMGYSKQRLTSRPIPFFQALPYAPHAERIVTSSSKCRVNCQGKNTRPVPKPARRVAGFMSKRQAGYPILSSKGTHVTRCLASPESLSQRGR